MRVLVTRAEEDAARTALRLENLGHRALTAPVIHIVPTADSVPEGSFDGVIVTSLHAADALATLPDRDLPVFIVGPRTARAVASAGFSRLSVAGGDAVSLSALIRREHAPPARLLHVTGRHHKDEPALSLQAAGYDIVHWEAYEARPTGGLGAAARDAIAGRQIDGVLHYSRRSAELFVDLAEAAGLIPALAGCQHFCLSDDVAEPLRALGFPVVVATSPEETALLRLLKT